MVYTGATSTTTAGPLPPSVPGYSTPSRPPLRHQRFRGALIKPQRCQLRRGDAAVDVRGNGKNTPVRSGS